MEILARLHAFGEEFYTKTKFLLERGEEPFSDSPRSSLIVLAFLLASMLTVLGLDRMRLSRQDLYPFRGKVGVIAPKLQYMMDATPKIGDIGASANLLVVESEPDRKTSSSNYGLVEILPISLAKRLRLVHVQISLLFETA